jgi:hypothetical protein
MGMKEEMPSASVPGRRNSATGLENPSVRILFRHLMARLVVPDRYGNRERSPPRRFASYGIPTLFLERLERDVGLVDCDVRLRQPIIDFAVNREPVRAAEGFDFHGKSPVRRPMPVPATERWMPSRRLSVLLGHGLARDTFRLVARRAQKRR